jgi:DNA-binding transcriptional ArsR family regulator
MSPAPSDTIELSDPRAMRALAHPARLAILELLHANGTANATECARELDVSPQAASYHLRSLARWGLIRRIESDDGRESRWTLVAQGIMFTSGKDEAPGFRQAAKLLGRRVLERDERFIAEYLAVEEEFEREWRDAATLTTGSVYVTAAELEELARRHAELVHEYERKEPSERPEGSRRVHLVFRAVPRVEGKPKKRRRRR